MLFDAEARKQLKTAGSFGAIGIEMVVSLLLGYFAGRWLDGRLEMSPLWSYIGLGVGSLAGVNALYRAIRRYRRLEREEETNP